MPTSQTGFPDLAVGGGGDASYPDFTDNELKILRVNAAGDDVEWIDPDTPTYPSFTGNAGKYLRANDAEDAAEWADLTVTVTDWVPLALTNGDFETGDGTGWTTDVGSIRINEWAAQSNYDTAGMTEEVNGTYHYHGGESGAGGGQAHVSSYQDIVVDAAAGDIRLTATGYKNYEDSDKPYIEIEQFDESDGSLGTDRYTMSASTITSEAMEVEVPCEATMTYCRIRIGVQRFSGSNNNASLDNVEFSQYQILEGSMTGAQIQTILDAYIGHTNWRLSTTAMALAFDALFGQSGWRNPAPAGAVKARYWRLDDFGSTMALAEVEFIDPDNQRMSGTFSAVNVVSGSSIAASQDDNPSTYWGSATATSDPWFQLDLGEGNDNTVKAIALTAHDHRKPNAGFGLYYSDDGSNWTLAYTAAASSYSNFERKEFDVRSGTYGEYDGHDLKLALDRTLGSTGWRGEGGIGVDTSSFDAGDTGKPLVYDYDGDEFLLGDAIGSFLLGGGMELLDTVSLSGESEVAIDHSTYSINDYDRIHLVFSGADGNFDIELSSDGGSTTQDIWKWTSSTASSHTQNEWGPTADNVSASLGHAVVEYHSIAAPTVVQGYGAAVGAGTAMAQRCISQTASITNAITVAKQDASTFSAGTLYIIGEKKSRQPVEFAGRVTSAWTAGDDIAVHPTMGTKFRAGVVGVARVDAAPGSDCAITIKNEAGTTIASGTIGSGDTEADLTAAGDATVTDLIVLEATGSPGSSTELSIIVRGEFA